MSIRVGHKRVRAGMGRMERKTRLLSYLRFSFHSCAGQEPSTPVKMRVILHDLAAKASHLYVQCRPEDFGCGPTSLDCSFQRW